MVFPSASVDLTPKSFCLCFWFTILFFVKKRRRVNWLCILKIIYMISNYFGLSLLFIVYFTIMQELECSEKSDFQEIFKPRLPQGLQHCCFYSKISMLFGFYGCLALIKIECFFLDSIFLFVCTQGRVWESLMMWAFPSILQLFEHPDTLSGSSCRRKIKWEFM